ncbi:MAG: hypothetical protein LBQ22_00065 [Bacteroidales bacterium]|nr:hypothetical protein [Bacteroidales bacterium]
MKKTIILTLITILLFSFFSCNSPKKDVKKMLEKMTEFTDILNNAAEDGILDDDEITVILNMFDEIESIVQKYNEGSDKREEFDEYLLEYDDEVKEITGKMIRAYSKIAQLEGADKLNKISKI